METTDLGRDLVIAALTDLGLTRGAATGIARDWPELGALADATPERLARHGVRPVQARRIAAAFRLVRLADGGDASRAHDRPPYRDHVRAPEDVARVARALWGHAPAEHFAVFLLDARQAVIDHRVIAIGTLANVDVHPRELFAAAIGSRAHSVILVHNHPSGDPEPSEADLALTRRMAEIGRLVGIPVLDHLVVTAHASCSIASLGGL